MIRLIAAALAERWKQPVIVDSRPGAEGITAVRAMIDAADDHTLIVAPVSVVTTNAMVRGSLPYRVEDLAPATTFVEVSMAVVVGNAFTVASVHELVATAAAKPPALEVGRRWQFPFGFATLGLQRR